MRKIVESLEKRIFYVHGTENMMLAQRLGIHIFQHFSIETLKNTLSTSTTEGIFLDTVVEHHGLQTKIDVVLTKDAAQKVFGVDIGDARAALGVYGKSNFHALYNCVDTYFADAVQLFENVIVIYDLSQISLQKPYTDRYLDIYNAYLMYDAQVSMHPFLKKISELPSAKKVHAVETCVRTGIKHWDDERCNAYFLHFPLKIVKQVNAIITAQRTGVFMDPRLTWAYTHTKLRFVTRFQMSTLGDAYLVYNPINEKMRYFSERGYSEMLAYITRNDKNLVYVCWKDKDLSSLPQTYDLCNFFTRNALALKNCYNYNLFSWIDALTDLKMFNPHVILFKNTLLSEDIIHDVILSMSTLCQAMCLLASNVPDAVFHK